MKQIQEQIRDSREWLFKIQDSDGGWPTEENSILSTLNTAEVIIGLISCSYDIPGSEKRKLAKSLKFLSSTQTKNGSWEKTGGDGNGTKADLIRTVTACRAIANSLNRKIVTKAQKKELVEVLEKGYAWIESLRNDDGGWGYIENSASGQFETCFVVRLLLDLNEISNDISVDPSAHLDAGLQFLASRYKDVLDLSTIHHAIHSALCFQYSQKDEYCSLADNIIDWISSQKSSILTFTVENVIIANEDTYTYTVLVDTLLLELLSISRGKNEVLIKKTLQSINSRIDVSGGVYGNKCVSWSTSKTLHSLYKTVDNGKGKYMYSESLKVKWGPILMVISIYFLIMALPIVFRIFFPEIFSEGAFSYVFISVTLVLGYFVSGVILVVVKDIDILSPVLGKVFPKMLKSSK